ncbi:MAG: peptidylprolyl isomerase [Deltaproteobacteria bacterium]|nr:peptidylprolyl isomerase [Deltaproteobacteria bacterium]
MKVAKRTVVTIDYTLTSDEGEVIDSSSGGEPLAYLHGVGNIVPGLESALDGRDQGESVNVKVAPGEGYGERDPKLVHRATRAQFQGIDELEVGMRFQARSGNEMTVVTVVAVEGDDITLDANHPLAGVTLNFDVRIVGVRPATPVELEHGHPHGADGNHHH